MRSVSAKELQKCNPYVLFYVREWKMDDECWYDANRAFKRKDIKANECGKCKSTVSSQSLSACHQCPRKLCANCDGLCSICAQFFNY